MDTEEMYRRGLADGERGDLHAFYYQHYYHYRRGYDRARKRNRQPDPRGRTPVRRAVLVLAVVAAVVVGSNVLLSRTRPPPQTVARAVSAPTVVRVPTVVPTVTFPPLTATLPPEPTPVTLQTGGRATVTNQQGLNARQEPRLKARVRAIFKTGEEVQIVEGPIEADGYIWWRIENQRGAGWSAQQSKNGQVWLQVIATQ